MKDESDILSLHKNLRDKKCTGVGNRASKIKKNYRGASS